MKITKEQFIYYMNELKTIRINTETLNNALLNYDNCPDFAGFSNMRVESLIISLLELITNDLPDEEYGYSTISYFIDDLEFGEKYTPGCITENNGEIIDISTIEKLYDYLAKVCEG